MLLENREVVNVYRIIDGKRSLVGTINSPVSVNGYWIEMTKGEKKALLIKGLVSMLMPTGDYFGVVAYKHTFDDNETPINSEVIHFVRRGE